MIIKKNKQSPMDSAAHDDHSLWYRDRGELKIGQISRYTVSYTRPLGDSRKEIHLRLKNTENSSIRAVHLLTGPFILYCSVVPCNYNYHEAPIEQDHSEKSDISYTNDIHPGQAFKIVMKVNENSRLHDNVYQWTIDVVPQTFLTHSTHIAYDLMLGTTKKALKKQSHRDFEDYHKPLIKEISVAKIDEKEIWDTKPKYLDKPVHLVWITHGLFSNLTADMLYLKETIESFANDSNVLIRGCTANAGKTEQGVKKQGKRVANALVDFLKNTQYNIDKISFIGHSLGGLNQLYAIKYILYYYPKTFDNIVPINFITLASPLLGILTEKSFFISLCFDIGILGKTGRDLTLCRKFPSLKDIQNQRKSNRETHQNVDDPLNNPRYKFKSLLEMLPLDPVNAFLRKFENLTLYANAINDGIVPLRTSALLYLDWSALGDIDSLQKNSKTEGDEGLKSNVKSKKEKNSNGNHNETNNGDDVSKNNKNEEDSRTLNKENKENGSTLLSPNSQRSVHSTSTSPDSVGEIPDPNSTELEPKDPKKKLSQLNMNVSHSPTTSLKHIKESRLEKRLKRIEVKGVDVHASENGSRDTPDTSIAESMDFRGSTSSMSEDNNLEYKENGSFKLPPKASAVISAINSLYCPLPTEKFLIDPSTREDPIFHDKYYNFDDLPPPFELGFFDKLKSFIRAEKINTQIQMAREYHDHLRWRKVLVKLPPDAHNNIAVRRRFTNAYGWGVIDHLCTEFFSDVAAEKDDLFVKQIKSETAVSLTS